jgi:hypothetical protein
MNPTRHADLDLTLTRWAETLATALGDSLQAVVLYGGLAKGEFVPDQSDVNVVSAPGCWLANSAPQP